MFNDHVWRLYLKAGGSEMVEMFRRNMTERLTEELVERVRELHRVYCPEGAVLDWVTEDLETAVEIRREEIEETDPSDRDAVDRSEDAPTARREILRASYEMFREEGKRDPKAAFMEFSDGIASYSLLCSIDDPDLFVPWFFPFNFNVFTMIAEEFGIDLPTIPAKKDYEGRYYYYGAVCDALGEFRSEHGLDPFELCAFLYDFAPKYIGGTESYLVRDLPDPKGAFFIGAPKAGVSLAEESGTFLAWQCDPAVRAGDQIVMYVTAPVSAVCSVWRACSVGFIDPFCLYYQFTYIGHPIPIRPVTSRMMRADPALSRMWIVRKNMQGIDGVELAPSEYGRILDLSGTDLPRLDYGSTGGDDADIHREKDVEDLRIRPLLRRLGYTEDDYVQQLHMRVGARQHILIPDFVLLPRRRGDRKTGFAVIEAKWTVSTPKMLEKAKIQARSYAKLLGAKYQMVASREKIWLWSDADDFETEISQASWAELDDADRFARLYPILRRR